MNEEELKFFATETTHYQGCACHEARWAVTVERITKERDTAREMLEKQWAEHDPVILRDAKKIEELKAALQAKDAEIAELKELPDHMGKTIEELRFRSEKLAEAAKALAERVRTDYTNVNVIDDHREYWDVLNQLAAHK